MDFNLTIKDKFTGLLEGIGFKISEDNKNSLTFKSHMLTIRFAFNPFASECNYFINLNASDNEFENSFVEGYLNIKDEPVLGLKTQDEKIDIWATRKHNYFLTFKDTLLTGDKKFFSELNSYFDKVCADYNK